VAYQYLLLYKPYDVLSQFTDDPAKNSSTIRTKRRTLKEFVSVPNVYAVGRLDRDSEGLLLLTDDGPMQHRLSHPRYGHRRQYWVQIECAANSQPIEDAIAQLSEGVIIRGYRTRPAEVSLMREPDLPPRDPPIRYRKQIPTAWLEIVLNEGKNRQVRRMTAAVGYPTLRLVRSALFLPGARQSVGKGSDARRSRPKLKASPQVSAELALTLAGLLPGQWRSLSDREVRSLPRSGHSRA
jgi:23S rRNA pseudouridine2457 synthase